MRNKTSRRTLRLRSILPSYLGLVHDQLLSSLHEDVVCRKDKRRDDKAGDNASGICIGHVGKELISELKIRIHGDFKLTDVVSGRSVHIIFKVMEGRHMKMLHHIFGDSFDEMLSIVADGIDSMQVTVSIILGILSKHFICIGLIASVLEDNDDLQ